MSEYNFVINGTNFGVDIVSMDEEKAIVEVNGTRYEVGIEQLFKQKKTPKLAQPKVVETSITRQPLTEKPGKDLSMGTIKSPLPGLILEIPVKVGDQVKSSQTVIRMEAMKMENDIQSPVSGTVKEILVSKGDNVLEGAPLMKIE